MVILGTSNNSYALITDVVPGSILTTRNIALQPPSIARGFGFNATTKEGVVVQKSGLYTIRALFSSGTTGKNTLLQFLMPFALVVDGVAQGITVNPNEELKCVLYLNAGQTVGLRSTAAATMSADPNETQSLWFEVRAC
jgi:hypothetical protein